MDGKFVLRFYRGLTLIELLVSVFIFIILCALTVPQWQHFLAIHRMNAEMNRLIHAIQLTRNEAIKRGVMVTLCGGGRHHCDGDWSHGMKVLVPSTHERIRWYEPSRNHLVWRSSLGRNGSLSFIPDGFTDGQQGTFYLCPAGSLKPRELIVNHSGRLREVLDAGYAVCSSSEVG